jgi:hypothetical protein
VRCVALMAFSFVCLIAAGCGSQDESTPVACLEGPTAYEKALAAAPGKVLLGGETPISNCLVRNQQGGDLATVGEAMVTVATKLNAEARAEPGGDAELRLGYLVGAVERGAEHGEGIHADLLRRLIVAARYVPDKQPRPPRLPSTYREGFDAGHSSG